MIVTIIKGIVLAVGLLGLAFGAFLLAIFARDELQLRRAKRRAKQLMRGGHRPRPAPGLPVDGPRLDGYEETKLASVIKGYQAASAVTDSSDEKEIQR